MAIQWDDLKTVLAVVRCGTLVGAAAELGLNYTTVARRIERAERAIGEVLFERLPDGYHPTDIAHLVAQHATEMEQQNDALLRKLQGRDQSLTGTLVITAPQLLIGPHLAPVLDQFCAKQREVDLRVHATNDLLDLNRRAADLAIRISRNPGDSLTGLRLCAQQTASFANAEVAKRIKDDPKTCIDWIVYGQGNGVPKASLKDYPNARVRMEFDDMVAMVGAAQAGLGVVRMPMFLGRATDGLVQVPVLQPQPYMDIWVVGHSDVWPSAKVAAFREILVPHFRSQRACFVA
jgi:DNA-binding transcriptional LysR family regulator